MAGSSIDFTAVPLVLIIGAATAANPTQIAGENAGEAASAASQPPVSNRITSFLDTSPLWKVARVAPILADRLPDAVFFSLF